VIPWIYGLTLGFSLGGLPFAYWLYVAATGRDLRREGSGNPGATNLLRSAGWRFGLAAFVLDAGKGAVAVLAAARLAGPEAGAPAALGAALGHMYSPWLSGRGGKGVATAAGAFAALAPAATGLALAGFTIVLALSRFVSLAAVAAAAALPLIMLALGARGKGALVAAALAVLIAWRHRENFARMRAGTEPRVERLARGSTEGSR
jgi:acyl phosphate:glycerol-3-phosphate acyltransferase